uniref:Putative secreted protein n=1 Tax=Anopheles darlingi TaxID=43151 RepID=A0A2M4DIH3_ANODA
MIRMTILSCLVFRLCCVSSCPRCVYPKFNQLFVKTHHHRHHHHARIMGIVVCSFSNRCHTCSYRTVLA